LVQAVTLAIALVGAILGVINTWFALDRARVKLLVCPKHAFTVGHGHQNVECCIEVTNLSTFAITVEEAGFFFKGTDRRGAIVTPIFTDGGTWPRRLEPRSSIAVYSQAPRFPGRKIRCAYARTQCGYTVTGKSPAMYQLGQ
jgi:hypothetical protein